MFRLSTMALLMLVPGSPGRKALETGPLFKASYYPGEEQGLIE